MAIRQPITTKPMYLYLEDGVPTRATGFFNHNALYEVNLPQSGGIEVLKGPGTALYGSDAIGGVVNALTRPAPAGPQVDASVEGGAYGWQRALITSGTSAGRHGVRADLNFTRMQGWRADAPYDRQSGTVRWDVRLRDNLSAKSVVTASRIEQHDVLTQNAAQFNARSPINRSPLAFRDVEALRWSTAIDYEGTSDAWSITPYARRNVLDLLPFWQLTFDPQVWSSSNTSLGLLAKYRRDFAPWRSRLIVGMDVDRSPGSFVADQAVLTSTGTGAERVYASYEAGARHYDYDVRFFQASPYAHGEFSPVPRVRIDAGVRYDNVSYDYTTNLSPTDTGAHRIPPSQQRTYRRASPKVGATLDVGRGVNAYGSWRTGFRAPSHSNLFQQNTALNSTGLRPVTVNSVELGLRGEAARRLAWSVSAYDMRINNDIITFVTESNTREATNAGATRHRGLEGAVGARVSRTVRLDVSAAVATQRYVTWQPQAERAGVAEIRYDGNRMEQAPATLGNALLTWTPTMLRGGRLAAEWSHTGRYDTDPANVAPMYAGHELLSLHANVYVRPNIELFGRAVNVLDRNYAELVAFDRFQGLQFTPGNPRSVFFGVRLSAER
jgi:outer membrane receptor protein involved in Fe transport